MDFVVLFGNCLLKYGIIFYFHFTFQFVIWRWLSKLFIQLVRFGPKLY